MNILNTLSLKSNRQIKINFDGGDLSSDAGLLLIKEFVSKLGIAHAVILNLSMILSVSCNRAFISLSVIGLTVSRA